MIAPGTRLGPYEIVAPIGAGGMGEVFRATDTRLDRSVAIKVLPSHLSSDLRFRERFDREARAVSALNHPNICTLHDVGHHEGIDYIVMELLEGETLADRLTKGPLPLEQVLRYGAQIADGLDKAHRQGIVHRDLKPANVMITKAGVKLLDFGLAKTLTAVSAVSGLTNQATEQRPLTQEGTILGTFQYMAPEQLEGEEADPRTDIFGLGAVLYEMVTGRRAFDGKTKTSLIAAIVGGEPRALRELQPLTPPGLEHVIAKCLEKEPDGRWQSAHDVAEELKWISGSSAVSFVPRAPRLPAPIRLLSVLLPWVILLASLAWWYTRREAPVVTTSSIISPEGFAFDFENGSMQLSPDGRTLAFVAADSSNQRLLFVRELANPVSRALQNTDNAELPFWSADGRFIGFFSDGKLKTIDRRGGPAQIIAEAPDERGGTWAADGTIVFAPNFRDGLFRVASTGGTPVRLTSLAPDEISHRWPVFLPDGEHVLFLAQRAEGGASADRSSIDVLSLKTKERKQVLEANSSIKFAPPGHLIFARGRILLTVPFDVKRLVVTGSQTVIAEGVSFTTREETIASVSPGGILVYQVGGNLGRNLLAAVDRKGLFTSLVPSPAHYFGPALSHDGKKVAFSIVDQTEDLRVLDLVRGVTTRLTFGSADEHSPIWSPDDTMIAFTSNSRDGGDIFLTSASGGGVEQPLIVTPERTVASDWSSDRKWLLLTRVDPKTLEDIWLYSFDDRRMLPFLQTPFSETEAVFSPDSRWIAYTSSDSGRTEVYVQSRTGSAPRTQVSVQGGRQPRWRRDGKELYYVQPGRGMMAAEVAVRETFETGPPRLLFNFQGAFRDRISGAYAVGGDGEKFVVITEPTVAADAPITLVQNWVQTLRK